MMNKENYKVNGQAIQATCPFPDQSKYLGSKIQNQSFEPNYKQKYYDHRMLCAFQA